MFHTVRTDRLTVKLKELDLGSLKALAKMPAEHDHAWTTAMLNCCIEEIETGPADVRDWTVSERIFVKTQYMACTLESGPNFLVHDPKDGSDPVRLIDYLQTERDYTDGEIPVKSFTGEKMIVRHLTGRMAESIERVVGRFVGQTQLSAWEMCLIAVQYDEPGGQLPDVESLLDQTIIERVEAMDKLTGLQFMQIYAQWRTGFAQLQHLVQLSPSLNDGLVCIGTGGRAGIVPPAVFPVAATLPAFAFSMVGKSQQVD